MTPYLQGIPENIGCILRQENIKVTFKPLRTMKSLFLHPKHPEWHLPAKIWHIVQNQLHQLQYYGQAERLLKTWISEHKRTVCMFDHDCHSKISCHVHKNNHIMDFGPNYHSLYLYNCSYNCVKIVGHEANFHEWLFLEAWLSIKNPQSGNDSRVNR